MIELRSYQKKVIQETYALIRANQNKILIVAPTGSGKTIVGATIISAAVTKNRRVLFLVHRSVLIEQTEEKLAGLNIKCGFIKAGRIEDKDALVQIASVQTLQRRNNWQNQNFHLIIYDECHLVAFHKVARQIMKNYPSAIHLGLTATPWRLSKKESLGDIYTDIVCAPTPKELIQQGFIIKPCYYHLKSETLSNLEQLDITREDYDLPQLRKLYNNPHLTEQICNSWFEKAYNRPTIAFATGVAHAMHLAESFNDHGISSAVVTGKTPQKIRQELYQKLSKGIIKIIASCDALSEGFDVPVVSCVILARPTKSKGIYFQQVGRGLRLAPYKQDCIILDQAYNVLEHGYIEDLTEITLDSSSLPTNKARPALKVCPNCQIYIYCFYKTCPHCQHNFDLQKLLQVVGVDRLLFPEDEPKFNFHRTLLREAYLKKFAPSWAALKFKSLYGFLPPFDWNRGAIFDFKASEIEIQQYLAYLKPIAQRLRKNQEWIEKYMYLEFGKIE